MTAFLTGYLFLFAQEVPTINIDLGGLGDAMWNALASHLDTIGALIWTGVQDHLPDIGTALGSALLTFVYGMMRDFFRALWGSFMLSIPHELTDTFAPVTSMMPPPVAVCGAGISLALVLLGVRTILQGIPGRASAGPVDELIGRVAVFAAGLGMLTWAIGTGISLQQQMANDTAISGLVGLIPERPPEFGGWEIIGILAMLWYGVKLWFKSAGNVVHVAVAIVWSPLALVLGMFPWTSWVFDMWQREFSGRLGGAVLATIATFIGLGIAMLRPGALAFSMGAGAFMAASDLLDWLARGQGASMGGILGLGARIGFGAVGAASPVGAAAAGAELAQVTSRQAANLADGFGID